MQADVKFAAIIAAGGIGSRFAGGTDDLPKQLYFLKGLPLYMWSLLAFGAHEQISRIVLVAHHSILETMGNEIELHSTALNEKVQLVPGGSTRQESVFNGLRHLVASRNKIDFVLVHDAARPLISTNLIDRTIACVVAHGACTVAIPVSDTIKRVREGTIIDTIDRSDLYAVHTPQAARLEWLLKAHEAAARNNVVATDDAYILERAGYQVKIAASDRYNIKVTVRDDLDMCEALCDRFIGRNEEAHS